MDKAVKGQAVRRQSHYTYTDGPMLFLGQQIVRRMQDAGMPAKIHCLYRSPADQAAAKRRGASRAGPFESPHQYSLAVDIIHERWAWFVNHPQGEGGKAAKEFWDTLAACARIVGEQYGVELELGYDWGWDSAHIEINDWRTMAARFGRREPTKDQLAIWFAEVLPKVWRQHQTGRSDAALRANRIKPGRHPRFPRLSALLSAILRDRRGG